MDFNIQKHIDNFRKKHEENNPELKKIRDILRNYYSKITISDFTLNKGIIYLNEISPIVRTSLKMKKNKIIKEIERSEINIRDIV